MHRKTLTITQVASYKILYYYGNVVYRQQCTDIAYPERPSCLKHTTLLLSNIFNSPQGTAINYKILHVFGYKKSYIQLYDCI